MRIVKTEHVNNFICSPWTEHQTEFNLLSFYFSVKTALLIYVFRGYHTIFIVLTAHQAPECNFGVALYSKSRDNMTESGGFWDTLLILLGINYGLRI